MIVTELRIQNLRNLSQVTMEPHRKLNFIVGKNGAGKTSVLESLVVLSRGRSFRTSQALELMGPATKSFTVFATTSRSDGGMQKLGLERSGRHWRARKDTSDVRQISELTRSLPIILMEPNSHSLVDGPPEVRRKFLDWGLFHVEHGYLDVWGRFSKALKQRNAALRNQQTDLLDSLDAALLPPAESLDRFRSSYASDIDERVTELLEKIGQDLDRISVSYFPGWKDGDLADALAVNRERDLERGQTVVGPHRADLVLKSGGQLARTKLSRGEQKALSASLILAQAELVARDGEKPVVLLDDLASEFDSRHFRSVLEQALVLGDQVWVTGTFVPDLPKPYRVFHVEHGGLQEMV